MHWTTLKSKIAGRYCGTVVVLDDEIYSVKSDDNSWVLNKNFQIAKQAFEKNGALCDLRQIDDQFETRKTERIIEEALQRCDTVVVDWYLGKGKDNLKDPVNALKVLRQLRKSNGIRFAAIHSKENPDSIVRRLREEFKKNFTDLGVKKSETPAADEEDASVGDTVLKEADIAQKENSKPSTYRIGTNLYVCVIHKNEVNSSAADLPQLFRDQLNSAFPDQLHWIGFEFASRVRDMLPRLIRSLPSSLDSALVFQSLFQDENELADDVAECLCLELQELFRLDHLESAKDSIVLGRFLKAAKPLLRTGLIKGIPAAWKPAIVAIKPNNACIGLKDWAIKTKILEDKGRRATLNGVIHQAIQGITPPTEIAHNRYAALREHSQSVPQKDLSLYPGVILKSTIDRKKGEPIWLLCVTPACDCARVGKYHHLFVSGYEKQESSSKNRSVKTSIRIDDTEVEISWILSSFKTIKCGKMGPTNWRPITRLRNPFVNRIIQKLWGQQSRVGVNTSEFKRKMRGDDE